MTVATQAPPADPLASSLSRALMAIVRIGVALMWIQNVAWKRPPDFGRTNDDGLFFWASQAVEYPVFTPYSAFVESLFLPNIEFFGWIILLVEGGLGAFLLVGLATRFWAVVGLAQTLAIALSVLNAPHEWHWSYYLMFFAHLAIFATAAGRWFGLDGVLRPGWMRSSNPLAKAMVRLS
ncbi:DoxX family protein [Agromyces bauzanensis]|uniref:TQO small subunit DoxD domain-containing protein n=1 Tax=Agromyces bauzanensis TaxID=1308924 RepID=A0A917PKI9_9MICO|nr:TQO small subunit DoxD [Agromyces bauzanensis]GGJ82940.1 hypothetical protein GCM10011372_21540 [Agromyces bauzanensis]